MEFDFVDCIKGKDNVGKIPYLGIYKNCFYEWNHETLFVPRWLNDTGVEFPLVIQKYKTFSANFYRDDGGEYWERVHRREVNICQYEFEQLKQICPPMRLHESRFPITYSFPEIIRTTFRKTNPTSSQLNQLQRDYHNKTYNYYCFLYHGREISENYQPTAQEVPYLRDFFKGYKGITIKTVLSQLPSPYSGSTDIIYQVTLSIVGYINW